jgi:ureidoacrylate peracid hydrolase
VPGEHVVKKSRYNGFIRTDLDDYLRAKSIRHLLFTGIATNVCVESTARQAFFNEYWPILVEDAMNNSGPDFNRQATLWNFEHVFGWVTHSRDVVAALQTQGAEAAA